MLTRLEIPHQSLQLGCQAQAQTTLQVPEQSEEDVHDQILFQVIFQVRHFVWGGVSLNAYQVPI